MKIIADTNIWYYFAQNDTLFEENKTKLIYPTFVNIFEIIKSNNIIDKEDLARKTARRIFHFKNNIIFGPPEMHIIKLHNNLIYNKNVEIGNTLEFFRKFANGHTIKEEYMNNIIEYRNYYQKIADFFNDVANEIKSKIFNNKKHLKNDTFNFTTEFINNLIKATSNNKYNLDDFDFGKIELLCKTLDYYSKRLEIGKIKMQPNDWFDFLILAYIQPGDKYWTREKRWKNLIIEAKCSNYLFEI